MSNKPRKAKHPLEKIMREKNIRDAHQARLERAKQMEANKEVISLENKEEQQ